MNRKPRILVVDDEEIVRRSYSRVLNGAHCDAETAWSGQQALEALSREPFDVVLLDLRMPGCDGIDVLRSIRRRWPDSQVVVITGYPTLETAKEAVRLGVYDYLSKPVGPETVIRVARDAAVHKHWALHAVPQDYSERSMQ